MAQIDIQGLFKDVLPNEAIEDKAEGLRQADLVGTLGGMAAYYGPQRERQLRGAAGGLLGVDLRSEPEKAREELQKLGRPQTDEEHRRYADILDRVQAGAGVQYMMGIAQEKREQEKVEAQTRTSKAQKMQAETSRMNANLQAQLEPIKVKQQERNLDLLEQGQIDENAYNSLQLAMQQRRNNIDEFNAQTARNRLNYDVENLTTYQLQQVNTAVDASTSAALNATSAITLAHQFLELAPDMSAGNLSILEEQFKEWMGTEDNKTQLIKAYEGLVSKMTGEALPPGSASDVDVQLARKQFLPANASPEQIASWLRGYAKLQAAQAVFEREKAMYLSENKGNASGWPDTWEEMVKTEEIINDINTLSGQSPIGAEPSREGGVSIPEARQALIEMNAGGNVGVPIFSTPEIQDFWTNRATEQQVVDSFNMLVDQLRSQQGGGQ